MNILSVENLTKTFGDKILFRNISFGIAEGQKIGLIARNGAGKTTLMNIIGGLEKPDSGLFALQKDVSMAFLPQNPLFDASKTISEAIFQTLTPLLSAVRNYEIAIELHNEDPNQKNTDLLQTAMTEVDALEAWDYEQRIQQILYRLNIKNLNQKTGTLSGGQLKRLALAKVLIENPNFLILDEPTNHLDLDMIEWLEEYLSRQGVAVLLVTHDRYFLDKVCTEIIELDNYQLYKYKGNYAYYLEKKSEREFNEGQVFEKNRQLLKQELDWMRRQPKARTTKSKARIDTFYELDEKVKSRKTTTDLTLNVKMNRIGGKIIELKNIRKAFGEQVILKNFDYVFKGGERIGIVGKNGVGKSTFLNILMDIEKVDAGTVVLGDTMIMGYYSQQGLILDEDKRVIEVVKEIAEFIPLADGSKVSASQFLTLFQFEPEQQYTFVSKLSGGERRRLHLLTILIKNPNFLILDEPTNDLDLPTLNVLEDFLLNFKGCLIIVSHDRYFMDKLVDHLFVFEGNGIIKDFNGNYQDYRDDIKEKEAEAKRQLNAQKNNKQKPELTKTIEAKPKPSYKEQQEYEQLEKQIEQLEQQKTTANQALSGNITDRDQIAKHSKHIDELNKTIDQKTVRWLELAEKM